MDGWGSLAMLIKRQEAAKNRKAKLKYDLQKRKESFLNENPHQELAFPEISKEKLHALKQEIRKKHKKIRIKSILLNISLLLAFICLVFYFIYKKL